VNVTLVSFNIGIFRMNRGINVEVSFGGRKESSTYFPYWIPGYQIHMMKYFKDNQVFLSRRQ